MNKRICVLDVEAIGLSDKRIYDIGITIIESEGKIVHTDNWIIKEVFDNIPLFNTAYFQCKRPLYEYAIKHGQAKKVSWLQCQEEFNLAMDVFNVGTISAYNADYDISAMIETHRRLGNTTKFLNKFHQIWDIMAMACQTLLRSEEYHGQAKENNWLSPKGYYSTTAESCYKFISGNKKFNENHTALEDTKIESQILMEILKFDKDVPKGIVKNAWRLAQVG